jgi:hypothetical protein
MNTSRTNETITSDNKLKSKNNLICKTKTKRNQTVIFPFPPLPLFMFAMFNAYLKKNQLKEESREKSICNYNDNV